MMEMHPIALWWDYSNKLVLGSMHHTTETEVRRRPCGPHVSLVRTNANFNCPGDIE